MIGTRTVRQKGFSLIEMLIVIAIIGILAAVSLGDFSGSRAHGRDSARIADMERITLGLNLYYSACRRYPLSLTASEDNGGVCTQTLGTFLPGLPFTDPAGTDYDTYYVVNADANNYVVGMPLEIDNAVLADDIDDADVFGFGTLDCSGALMYCVGP